MRACATRSSAAVVTGPCARGLAFGAAWAVCCTLASAPPAHAQASLSGTWRAGATAIDVQVESWGSDCGPRPQSARSDGGGLVTIDQQDQTLILHGRGQEIRSDSCWSRNPSMKRNASTYSEGLWITRCRTAANDPRAEQGTYTLKLSDDDNLLYEDVSHYDWSLNHSKCVATFTTTQRLSRARNAKGEPVAVAHEASQRVESGAAPPLTAAETRACAPGAPTKFSLRPHRAEIELGKRVCFRARLSDAADCTVPNVPIEWSVSHSRALRGSVNDGCFLAADTAAEGQGEFHVLAKAAGLSAEATVVVRPIDMSALIAKRLSDGSGLTGFDENASAAPPRAIARIATHAKTEQDPNSGRRKTVLALGASAFALTLLGWGFHRRTRAAAVSGEAPALSERDEPIAARAVIVEASVTRSENEPKNALRASLPPWPPSPPLPALPPPASSARPNGAETKPDQPWICPTCRVGYPASQATCPKDGTALIPYAEFTERSRREEAERAKRCPTCGKSFPASASFCGEDGTGLIDG